MRSPVKSFDFRVVEPEQAYLIMEFVQVLQIGAHYAATGRDHPRRGFPVEINPSAGSPIGNKRQGFQPTLPRLKLYKCRHIAIENHLAHPHNVGLSINRVRRNAKNKPLTVPSFAKTSRKTRLFRGIAANFDLQTE